MIYVTFFCFFCTYAAHLFLFFAAVVKSSFMIIIDMWAFSVVPETTMSTTKPLSITFKLPPHFTHQQYSTC